MSEDRYLAIVASPEFEVEVDHFYDLETRLLLEDPPHISGRTSGFYVGGGIAHLIDGKKWKVGGLCGAVELSKTGVLSTIIEGQTLTWGMHKPGHINTLALVESVHSFCLLFRKVLDKYREQDIALSFLIEMANGSSSEPTVLSPGLPNHPFYRQGSRSIYKTLQAELAVGRPEQFQPDSAAVRVLEVIFGFFGFTSDLTPFTKEQNGVQVVDLDAVANFRS